MAWLKIETSLREHPKVLMVANLTKKSINEVLGAITNLWLWSLEYAEEGNLEKHKGAIEQLTGIDSEVWKASGFLDDSPLRIHDWWDYVGPYFTSKYKNNKAKLNKFKHLHKKKRTGVHTGVHTGIPSVSNLSIVSSLSSSKDNYLSQEVISNEVSKKSPQTEFVEKFKKAYESMTGQPFKMEKKHFVIAATLIKDHGLEAVEQKVGILGFMCRDKTAWFTRDGWADFTIEKLSSKWNSIIPQSTMTEEDKSKQRMAELLRKENEKNARINKAVGSK